MTRGQAVLRSLTFAIQPQRGVFCTFQKKRDVFSLPFLRDDDVLLLPGWSHVWEWPAQVHGISGVSGRCAFPRFLSGARQVDGVG